MHDAIFEQSNCFRRNAPSLCIFWAERIQWLAKMEDVGLPEDTADVDYNNLNQDQKEIVDDAMPFLFQLESDRGGDHNLCTSKMLVLTLHCLL